MAAYLPILTFHAFDEQQSVSSISPEVFEHGIKRLWDGGYRTMALSEIVASLRRGTPFPERFFALTFDDGYQSVYDYAFPLLQRYGMSATIFPTIAANGTVASEGRLSSQEGRSMLSWSEMREMQRSGMTFGAHSLTHRNLTRLHMNEIEVEVGHPKLILQDKLGVRVEAFAYPFGRYDDRTRDIVSRHFACACSDRLSLVTASSDLYTLERIDAYYLRTDGLFNLMPTKVFPWYLRARNLPRRIRRSVFDIVKYP